jgi:hypothetical protein
LSDRHVRGLLDAAREADHAQLTKERRGLAGLMKGCARRKAASEIEPQLVRPAAPCVEIGPIDFFSATGRLTVEGLLTELEARLAETSPAKPEEDEPSEDVRGKIWVTRRGVHVDRIACAWLVRRFIDANARFEFVAAKDYDAEPGGLRFDMVRAEHTHEGDKCTFEVMLDRIGSNDAALRAIAEIVHDIDLKDGKFGREHAGDIAHVIMTQPDDLARIERGSAFFDDTYEYFRRDRSR